MVKWGNVDLTPSLGRPPDLKKSVKRKINYGDHQCGITCGAIDEPSRSSKAMDKRVIINFRDKNVRFCDKNDAFYYYD